MAQLGDTIIKGDLNVIGNINGGQHILWRDIGGSYMHGSQIANLSQKISEQNNGIVLLFQPYDNTNNVPYPKEYQLYFIPKIEIATIGEGMGHTFMIWGDDFGLRATKYLYIYNNKIVGFGNNDKTLTIDGKSVNNRDAVLTAVFGV